MKNFPYCLRVTTSFIWLMALVLATSWSVDSLLADEWKCETELTPSEGKKTLQEVQSRYNSVTTFQAEFLQDSFLHALDISELSQGRVYIGKPGSARWKYFSPEEQDFLFHQGKITYYQPALRQALIEKADRFFLSELPVSFLMGIGDLEKDFEVQKACKLDDARILLELRPEQSKEKELDRFELVVNRESKLPVGARVFDISGNQTRILLEQLVIDQKLPDDVFSLSIGNETDVEDRTL